VDHYGVERIVRRVRSVQYQAELVQPCAYPTGHRRMVREMYHARSRGILDDVSIDLNADVGEVEDPEMLEVGVLQLVTSANIATGGHSGNPAVMDAAVAYCSRHGVSVGAHPSYPDREGFGRRVIPITAEVLRAELLAQIGALDAIARARDVAVRHVKPHGALYHQMVADEECASVVVGVVETFPGVALVAPAGSPLVEASWPGVQMIAEAFCDRGYRPDGSLVPRGENGDLLTDPEQAAEQAVSIATRRRVRATDGTWVEVRADSLCLHGDTPGAAAIGLAVRGALDKAGVRVAALF
jgi:5-oxoprolinase (ATP-hydrolysing) subunit A